MTDEKRDNSQQDNYFIRGCNLIYKSLGWDFGFGERVHEAIFWFFFGFLPTLFLELFCSKYFDFTILPPNHRPNHLALTAPASSWAQYHLHYPQPMPCT